MVQTTTDPAVNRATAAGLAAQSAGPTARVDSAHRDDGAPAGITVRKARPDEYDAVGRLTYTGFGHAQPGARQPTPERLGLLVDAAARARAGDLLVAADADGNLVGTASLLRHGTALTRQSRPSEPHDGVGTPPGEDSKGHAAGEAELRLLAVLPEARRLGTGRALMAEALTRAQAWGAPALVLDTGPGNLRSQRLYHRLGFDRLPARETLPSSSGGKLAVFRYPFDEVGGTAVRLAGRDEGGYDVWRFEVRGPGTLLATVTTHPIAPPDHRAPGPDVLAPIPHPVVFAPGAATAELRAKIAGHLGVLRHGGLVV